MPTPDARPNIPVPDRLAAVRAELKRLEAEEAELRQTLLSDPTARTGADWIAEIKETETRRVDLKELRAMHKDLVDEYTHPIRTVRIVLSGIDADTGEIVSARKMRQAEEAAQ